MRISSGNFDTFCLGRGVSATSLLSLIYFSPRCGGRGDACASWKTLALPVSFFYLKLPLYYLFPCLLKREKRSAERSLESRGRGEAFGRMRGCVAQPHPATKNSPHIRKKNISFATNKWNVLFVTFSGTIAENLVYGAKRKRRCQGSYLGRAVFGKRVRGERHFNPAGWYFPPSCSGRKVSWRERKCPLTARRLCAAPVLWAGDNGHPCSPATMRFCWWG